MHLGGKENREEEQVRQNSCSLRSLSAFTEKGISIFLYLPPITINASLNVYKSVKIKIRLCFVFEYKTYKLLSLYVIMSAKWIYNEILHKMRVSG